MGKKEKVVFDTNVWVSISLQKTLSDEFSQVNHGLTLLVSKDIMLEITKVLLYPRIAEILRKNGITEKEILRAIAATSKIVEPTVKLTVINENAEDNKILECALAAGAGIIVSGDKHLLDLGKYGKTRILTPREFFDSFT